MTRRALTDRLVQSLTSEGKSQFEHYDGFCPGLLLRVSSGGSKVWDLTFKSPTDGKRARLRIGRYPVVGLAKARDEAVSALAKVAGGQDPRIVSVEAQPKTIAELFEDPWTKKTLGGVHRFFLGTGGLCGRAERVAMTVSFLK